MKGKSTAFVTVVFLIMCLLLSMLAGCGAGSADKTQGDSPSAQTSNAQNTSGTSEVKPVLKGLIGYIDTDPDKYAAAQYLEKATGYKVSYEMLPSDNPLDKVNAVMAAGEDYDFISITGTDARTKMVYNSFANSGALVDLGPIIDKYGPNLKNAASDSTWDLVRVGGNIYALPSVIVPVMQNTITIRKDLLDALNMQMPATTGEFKELLKVYKQKDPAKLGSKGIPLTLDGATEGAYNVKALMAAFGMPNDWNEVDGQLVPNIMNPNYKDYLLYMADLYKDGLLDKEFAINRVQQLDEKLTSGRAFAVPSRWSQPWLWVDPLKKNVPDAKMAYTDPLKGPSGKATIDLTEGYERLLTVPRVSKHADDVIKWVNATLDPEVFKGFYLGEEGVTYNDQNGQYIPIQPAFLDQKAYAFDYFSLLDERVLKDYYMCRIRKSDTMASVWLFINQDSHKQYSVLDPLSVAPSLPNYSGNYTTANMKAAEVIKIIIGENDVSYLNNIIQSFKNNGGDAIVKEVNDWYSANRDSLSKLNQAYQSGN